MFRKQAISGKRIATAFLIAEMLFFALGVVPKHAAAHSSHETCKICALLHHPPILQTGALPPMRPTLRREFLALEETRLVLLEPRIDSGLTRAPPMPV